MKLKYFLLLFLTLTIIHQTSSIATVRFVSKTGTSTPPYTTWQTAADSIQKCINICVDGDTIYVANGVYKENLIINTAISLIGSSMDSTVIDGRGMGDITINCNANLILEGFHINGKVNGLGGAVIFSLDTLSIASCRINDMALGISGISRIEVNKVLFMDLKRGISGNEIIVSNSVFQLTNSDASGIRIDFAPTKVSEIKNNLIITTSSNPDNGISIGGPKSICIKNNLISGFTYNIYFDLLADSAFITNNLIVYKKNQNNTFALNTENDKVVIKNNVFANNKNGAIRGFPPYVDLNYNLFWQNQNDLYGLSYGDSDQVADPMFIKDTIPTANGDYNFHLQAFSPGIDKGDPNILDLDGSRSDIGMYGGPFGETYTYQDLAPLAPRNLSAVVDTNTILVKWNRNTEADTSFYKVYRDTVIGFQIDSSKLVSSSADTFFVQPNPHINIRYVYKVTCVDNQGNESKPSQELAVTITSVSTNDYPMTITDYVLYQNYPNPFNPSTKIGYQLKQKAYVKLMVYDIKGELVSVLVNKEQNAGYYEVEFSSSSIKNPVSSIPYLASGIYLYRIEVIGEGRIPVYTEMKKMLMIK